MLNLNELNIFLVAAECGNFSEAGRRLHLSQPAISQTISNLEKDMGMELFERIGRTQRLTEAGQVLKPMAIELLAGAKRLQETMASLQGEVVGELNIGCSTASGKYLLPGLIARFRRKYSKVRVNVIVNDRNAVIEKVISGEFSLGVSSKKIEHRELEYQEFFNDDVILIVSAKHAWAAYRQIYPDDLLDEPIILREESAGTLEVLLDGLHQFDITSDMLNIAMVLGNAEAIEMAVEEDIGIAFVSRLAAMRGIELGRVVEVKVDGLTLKRKIYLTRTRHLPLARAQLEFWDFVKSPQAELLIV